MNESLHNSIESVEARKERILTVFEKMREMTHDELVDFWHNLMAQEAELVHELKLENQVLSSILTGSGLQLVTDDDAATDDESEDEDITV